MTRKDYVMIADTIRELLADIDRDGSGAIHSDKIPHVLAGERIGVHTLAMRLGEQLRQDNPRFDRTRFMAACGFNA
jgi:hypothetical protein